MLSLLTPYAAYLVAERVSVSGILAVVAAGFYAGMHDTKNLSVATRRHAWEVWAMVLYVFNGLAFLLLGLQLKSVLERLPGESWSSLAFYALAVWAAVTLVRLAWVYPATYLPLLWRRIRDREGWRDPRAVFLVGWAGIRGSVTLAAALSIPFMTSPGTPFPGRSLILFLAGTTIVLTLSINGLTLPAFISWLSLRRDGGADSEERAARLAVAQAAANAHESRSGSGAGRGRSPRADRRLRTRFTAIQPTVRGASISMQSPRLSDASARGLGRTRGAPRAARHARHQRADASCRRGGDRSRRDACRRRPERRPLTAPDRVARAQPRR